MRRLAMPFVATLAVSTGCSKTSDNIAPLPPPTTSPTTTTKSPEPVPSGELTYDGHGNCYRLVEGEKKYVPDCPESLMPEPPKDQLVYKHGLHCQSAPEGKAVRCPASGPTAILPEPSSIKTGTTTVSLRYGSLNCHTHEEEHCPPNVACNPPPPVPVTCPPALMPKLAPGVKPTKIDGARCWFAAVEVMCPKP